MTKRGKSAELVFALKHYTKRRITHISRFLTAVMALVISCLFVVSGGQAFAQTTSPATLNGTYPTGTSNLSGSTLNTQNTSTLSGLGENQGVTFDFTGEVTNTAGGMTAHWQSGLTFTTANRLRMQVDDIDTTANDSATYTFDFSEAVYGLEFRVDDINFTDGFILDAFDDAGNPVALTTANIAGTGSVVTASVTGDSLYVLNLTDDSASGQTFFDFTSTLSTGIKTIVMRNTGKQSTGESGNVTLYFEGLSFASLADLQTVKTLASVDSTPAEGDTVTFLITVTNNGPNSATNASLTDSLPAGLTATGNNGAVSQGSYSGSTWSIGNLAVGASATLTLEGTVNAGQLGNTITNTTTAAQSDQHDSTTVGDDLVESVEVASPDANLITVKTLSSSDATPLVGDTVTFLITVTNSGSGDATGVSLVDSLPAGLTATAGNGVVSAGSYNGTSWTIGNLANGASATLTLEGTVDAGQGGNTITNITTAATGDQTDPTTDGDDLTESVDVIEILPDDETGVATSGTSSTPVANVTDGDTVNGEAAVIGTNASVSEVGTWPAGFSLNTTTGAVDFDGSSVAPGDYTMDYELCDTNTPANCEIATVTITVGADVVPDDETGTATSGTSSTPVANVTDGDLVNGEAAVIGTNASISEVGTWPAGFSLNTTTGAVDFDGSSVAPGDYTMDYELCDTNTPANCEIATVTITVGADVVPDDETGVATSGTSSTPVANVTDGDFVNGEAAVIGTNATVTESGTWPAGFSLNTTTGAVDFDGSSVAPGDYTMDYELCDTNTPANCEIATVTITVGADVVPDDETGTATSGTTSTPVANVTDGDFVNGEAAVIGTNATISESGTWPAGFSLNTTTGAVDFDGSSVAPGDYTMDYELCDTNTPANCETATVTITVGADVVPDDETGVATSGTSSTPVANVTDGDLVNGEAAVIGTNATVTESGTWPAGFSLNTTTGAVDFDGSSVAPGDYTMDYELCDTNTPANCEIATVTITVGADVVPDDETGTATSGTSSTPVANVTDGDLVNGEAAVIGTNASISEVGTWPAGFSLNTTTGAVDFDGSSVAPPLSAPMPGYRIWYMASRFLTQYDYRRS